MALCLVSFSTYSQISVENREIYITTCIQRHVGGDFVEISQRCLLLGKPGGKPGLSVMCWRKYDDVLSRLDSIPERDWRTNGPTEELFLYQYRASADRASAVVCWRAVKTYQKLHDIDQFLPRINTALLSRDIDIGILPLVRLCSEKNTHLCFSCITVRKSNQSEWKFQTK